MTIRRKNEFFLSTEILVRRNFRQKLTVNNKWHFLSFFTFFKILQIPQGRKNFNSKDNVENDKLKKNHEMDDEKIIA